jgi:hypothetical protein
VTFVLKDFGGHESQSSKPFDALGLFCHPTRLTRGTSEPEVEEFYMTGFCGHDISGREIPMHDSPAVGGLQGLSDLSPILERLGNRPPFRRNQPVKCFPVHPFHDDVADPPSPSGTVDRDNVRVIERRRMASFADEPFLTGRPWACRSKARQESTPREGSGGRYRTY